MDEKKIQEREALLEKRLNDLKSLENEIKKKEKMIKALEGTKKQVPLRLSSKIYEEISKWADEDFRSVNGQIEFILAEAIKRRKGEI